ncbi:nitronate monooxygenase [Neisseria sp. HSC-16F19]|nr:nitronate monooxygenase [Neisseria sp. HSC-16F19]MCP2039745.1 nitronate monooxygenase [Neisseria sp. HSC-16F19]
MSACLPSVYPLIQAPMAGAQDHRMAAAVCRAGGLGSLPAAMWTATQLAGEIEALRALTDAPFNVNFFTHEMPPPDEAVKARWQHRLQDYYRHWGVTADSAPVPLRRPFAAEQLEVLQQYRPAVVSFHFGLPQAGLMRAVKDTGAQVLASATTVAEAQWLADHGADVVIAQGSEAGGHRATFLGSDMATQTGLFALLPQVADAVPVPVVATGGIADERGIRAALALGASAVQLGTAYLLCHESLIGGVHRTALSAAAGAVAAETAISNVFSGKPARGLVNTLMRDLGCLNEDVAPFPYAAAATAALRSAAEAQGDSSFTPLWSGQNPHGCRAISAYDLTRDLCGCFEG